MGFAVHVAAHLLDESGLQNRKHHRHIAGEQKPEADGRTQI